MIKGVHVYQCVSPYAGLIDYEETAREVLEILNRRHRQLLVHSFLYYKCDESIIEDAVYDKWCREVVQLHKDFPEVAKRAVYYDICKGFDGAGSGYFIKDYPPEIINTAFHLLANARRVPFSELVSRYGYSVQGRG